MRKRVILWCTLLLFSTSVFLFLMWEDYKSKAVYEQLQEVADITLLLQNKPEVNEEGLDDGNSLLAAMYQELYEMNQHYMGWLYIGGTVVDYPVMQNREVRDYYLHRDFYGNYSSYGVPYIDEQCEVGVSNNLIIYGHAMKNGTMFADMLKYVSYEYYKDHSVIHYFDQYSSYEYEIFAAFSINLLVDDFFYTNYHNMTEGEFLEFLSEIKSRECYNTNLTPEYGDQLMTFSTCDSTYQEGRFVVVAVRKQ